jgi:hypothetical protein
VRYWGLNELVEARLEACRRSLLAEAASEAPYSWTSGVSAVFRDSTRQRS